MQNAEPITVHFLPWQITMSAALVIQLAAVCSAIAGIGVGRRLRRPEKPAKFRPINSEGQSHPTEIAGYMPPMP